ncbi:hypothetical protein E1301_Tti022482 [Triplophysa tibetana]|uniref:Uncharacterized protein n=1 Tax=Triplophysa tibetana TaxID=1572043 RepID=A0A5A9PG38_9TELE|nr:hypothetical protein E1301_Tti022482 [Triplophysa tibetana]
MSPVASLWLLCGSLCCLVLVADGHSTECLDKDEILKEMSRDVERPSVCVLTCTVLAYRQILIRQQKLTIRFTDSDAGEAGEFCWIFSKRCSSWDEVFVLLPVNQSLVNGETMEIYITEPIQRHTASSRLPEDCGMRFDVTAHLTQQQQQQQQQQAPPQTLCIRLTSFLENKLQCPPFLAMVKNKQKRAQLTPE